TGVICGYCAIGSATIATPPAMQIASAITIEKIGRSMKKCDSIGARGEGYGDAAGAPVGVPPATILTGTPADKRATPSTATTSPVSSPCVMNQSSPRHGPTCTGLICALFSLSITTTK